MAEGKASVEALDASLALVAALDAGNGENLRELFEPLGAYEHDPGGWTVYTTNLALLALLDASDFRSGVETVVRLGGDADTNAAVAGALLGARFGREAIPGSWLEQLEGVEELDG